MKTWKKTWASMIFSAALYLLSSAAITLLLLVHKHQYPTTPMMVSDLKIAAFLDGTLEEETERLKTFHLEIYDRRERYGRDARHVLGPENFTVDICSPIEEEWKAFVQHYLQA